MIGGTVQKRTMINVLHILTNDVTHVCNISLSNLSGRDTGLAAKTFTACYRRCQRGRCQ